MSRNESDVGELRAADGPEMIAAMRLGVIEALRDHKLQGRSVITWDRDSQQIVEIPPDQLVIPDELVEEASFPSKKQPS